MSVPRLVVLVLLAVTACRAPEGVEATTTSGSGDGAVVLDTKSAAARAQYDADVAFVKNYTPRCSAPSADPTRPRVIVTGFGRFANITRNGTALMVSQLVPTIVLPNATDRPVDDPSRELAVGTVTKSLAAYGDVDICGVVLPVFWDTAAIILAKEIDAFAPSFVLMNGVADREQPIMFALGAVNAAELARDGSDALQPARVAGADDAPIIQNLDQGQYARANLLSWRMVRAAVDAALFLEGSPLLSATTFAPFPRASNRYLCNNLAFVTGYLMDHPGEQVTLLSAKPRIAGRTNEVRAQLDNDFSAVPRVFVHWPSALADIGNEQAVASGVVVIETIIAAQLSHRHPVRGDNAMH